MPFISHPELISISLPAIRAGPVALAEHSAEGKVCLSPKTMHAIFLSLFLNKLGLAFYRMREHRKKSSHSQPR
jgi:hypothetical protein